MKTFTQHINEKESDKVYVVYDRDEIFINYYYNKDDAEKVVDETNNETPSMKYHYKEMNRSELEGTVKKKK